MGSDPEGKGSRGKGEEQVEPLGGSRITTLADGVFAIVMTLLVLGIEVPELSADKLQASLMWQVLHLWPRIATYVVSFLTLGIYWMGHHAQFHFIDRVNRTLLWIDILFFMAVCLVPYTTKLVGHYSHEPFALELYGFNFLLISFLLYVHWRYAATHDLLQSDVGDEHRAPPGIRQILVGPAIYALAMGVAYVSPEWSLLVFFSVPLLHLLPGPVHLHWTS